MSKRTVAVADTQVADEPVSGAKKGRDASCCDKPSSQFIPELCDGPCDQMDFRRAVNDRGEFYTGHFRGKGPEVVHNNNAFANEVMGRIIVFAAEKIRADPRFPAYLKEQADDAVYDAHRKMFYPLIKSYATYVEFSDDLYAAAMNLLHGLYRQVAFSLISPFTIFYFEFLNTSRIQCENIDLPRDFHRFYSEFPRKETGTTLRKDVIAITLTYFLTCTGRLDQELQEMMEFRPTVGEVDLGCLYLFSGLTAWPPHVIIGLKTTPMLNLYKSFTFNYEYARDRYARKYRDVGQAPDSTFVDITDGELMAIYQTYEYTVDNIKSVVDPANLNCELPLKIILVLKLGPTDKLCYISDTTTWEWEILIRSGYFTYMSHKYVIYADYGFNVLEICINFSPDPELISDDRFDTAMHAFVDCIATKYEELGTVHAEWRDPGEVPDPLYTPKEMAEYRAIFKAAKQVVLPPNLREESAETLPLTGEMTTIFTTAAADRSFGLPGLITRSMAAMAETVKRATASGSSGGGGYATFPKKAGDGFGGKVGKKRRKSIRNKPKNRRNKTYKKSVKSVKKNKKNKKKIRSSRKLY